MLPGFVFVSLTSMDIGFIHLLIADCSKTKEKKKKKIKTVSD